MEERFLSVKKYTDEMLVWVRGKGRIAIVVHDNPDPDCLASAVALRHLFVMKLNQDAVITFSGMIGRSENLAMAKELEIPMTPLGIVELSAYQVVCMLDTQPGSGNNALPADARVDIVVDHHPLRESTRQCRWVDVREEYGVTATILYEYLLAQDVYIGTKLATSLFYAIKSETQDLGREANRPDRDAYLRLFPLTNKKLLYQITHPRQPLEYYRTVKQTLDFARIYGHVVVVNMQAVAFPEVVAEMADFLLRLEGIETVLSMGEYSDEMILSIRTLRHDLNAGEVIKRIVEGRGSAGGHGMMAGGKVDNVPNEPDAMQEVEEFLTGRFLAEVGCEGVAPRLLVR